MSDISKVPNLGAIQRALSDGGIDGWLFSDFRGSDRIAAKVLGLGAEAIGTRRWYYYVPAEGTATALVHQIESKNLDALPGDKKIYLSWRSLEDSLKAILAGARRVAMQYSPQCHIPTISRADAGTVEFVRDTGVEVVSSGDLVQLFEARLSKSQIDSHRRAARLLRNIVQRAFGRVAEAVKAGTPIDERQVQIACLDWLHDSGLQTDHGPIVATNEHAADPHFEVSETSSSLIREGDLLLLDIWAKEHEAGAIFADITWCAYVGAEPPEKMVRVFDVVRSARDAAVTRCESAFSSQSPLSGYEVDRVARQVIEDAGYGKYFVHRTGHSIHEETHGNGANLDDLETHDVRQLIPETVFSVEPGVYLPGEFGIRSEVNVLHTGTQAEVTGGPGQVELLALFRDWQVAGADEPR